MPDDQLPRAEARDLHGRTFGTHNRRVNSDDVTDKAVRPAR